MTGACLASGPGPGLEEMVTMGTIAVHEFITLDGVIEAPSWSFDYPYDPAMGEAIGQIMGSRRGDPAGMPHLPGVRPGMVSPHRRRRPRRAVHERIPQIRRLGVVAGR